MRRVVDASALVEYLLRTPRSIALQEPIETPEADLHVPALADVEVASALVRLLLRGTIPEDRALEALQDLADLPLTRHGHLAMLPRILDLRRNFSPYDAVYVALAESLQAEIVTGDERLARAIHAHTAVPLAHFK